MFAGKEKWGNRKNEVKEKVGTRRGMKEVLTPKWKKQEGEMWGRWKATLLSSRKLFLAIVSRSVLPTEENLAVAKLLRLLRIEESAVQV